MKEHGGTWVRAVQGTFFKHSIVCSRHSTIVRVLRPEDQ
jgi:hypothetical protein